MKKLDEKIILAGHRGDRRHAPENTMEGFRHAIALGVDMIETDIHMSRDGVVFLMHDAKVDRTTNGTGNTCDMTWEEIRALDAGGWFSPAFAGAKVPSIEEFLSLAAATPGLWVNWEFKDFPENCGREHAFACADKALEGIYRWGLQERSMLNSFSYEVLEYIAEKTKGEIPIHGQGVGDTCKMRGECTRPLTEYWQWACLYGEPRQLAAKENFDLCLGMGLQPCICLPDVMENYRPALERGCRMFTSDDPEQADRLLRELGVR